MKILKPFMSKMRKRFGERIFKQILQDVGILLGGDFIASLIGLASLALTARALGPERLGALVLVQTFVLVINRIFSFESWQPLIKFGAENLKARDREHLKANIKLSCLLDFCSSLVGTVVAFSSARIIAQLLGWDPEISQLASFYSLAILFSVTGTPTGILRLFRKFSLFSLKRIATALLKFIGISIAYTLNADFTTYLIIWFAAEVFGRLSLTIAGHYVLMREGIGDWWKVSVDDWRPFVGFAVWSSLSGTITLPVKQLDTFIVSAVVSIEGVGLYRIFKQIAEMFAKLANPFYQTVYPQFAGFVSNHEEGKAVRLAAKTGALLLGLSLPAMLLLLITSPYWLDFIFGEAYASEWQVLGAFLFFKAIWTGAIALHPLFIALGYVRRNFFITLVSNAIYLPTAYFLGSSAGLVGIVLANMVAFLVTAIVRLNYILNHMRTLRSARAFVSSEAIDETIRQT